MVIYHYYDYLYDDDDDDYCIVGTTTTTTTKSYCHERLTQLSGHVSTVLYVCVCVCLFIVGAWPNCILLFILVSTP